MDVFRFSKGETMADFVRLCWVGNLKDVEVAIKSGADLNARYAGDGRTGLMMALIHKNTAVAALLASTPGVDINLADNCGNTALHWASMDDEMGDILTLILARPELTTINSQDSCGVTPLHRAIRWRATRCIDLLLLDSRTDPNIGDNGGISPIMTAAQKNHLPVLQLLLADTRVDLLTRDDYRRSEEEINR